MAAAQLTNANVTVALEKKKNKKLPLWLLPSIHLTDLTYMHTTIQHKHHKKQQLLIFLTNLSSHVAQRVKSKLS